MFIPRMFIHSQHLFYTPLNIFWGFQNGIVIGYCIIMIDFTVFGKLFLEYNSILEFIVGQSVLFGLD